MDYKSTFDDFDGFYSDDHFLANRGAYFDYLIKKRPPIDELRDKYNIYVDDPVFCSITITLNPKYRDLDELDQRRIVFSGLHATEIQYYLLYPDVDTNGNFHYHGIIKIPLAKRPKFKRFFTRTVGFIKLSYISDPDGWYRYMRKDKGFNSKEHKVPLEKPIYTDAQIQLYALSK